MHILRSTLESHDTFLDVGAGIGLSAIWASMHILEPNKVCAVEASPLMIEQIKENMRLNGADFEAIWAAVTTEEGEVPFFLAPHFWSSSLSERDDRQAVNVPAITLHSLIEKYKPTYIMMDVEGAEYELILNTNLDNVQKICVEIHPHYIGMYKAAEITTRLLECGFLADRSLCGENGFYFYRN